VKAKAPKAKAPAPFEGFEREALQFFHELTLEMNRDWFEANKERYRRLWVEPMTALLGEVSTRVAKAYAPIKLGEPKLFRIHRDVRFSKDKTPYKTHAAGMLPLHAGKKPVEGGCSALYMHIGIDEEYMGAGTYFFDPAQLARWRKLVAADKTGAEIAKLISKLRKAGYTVGGHDDYMRVPKGFAPDHPRADLLRMRGLGAAFPPVPRGMLHTPKLAAWIGEHARAVAPLVTWLYQRLR
jgi:uncharacterized protein (TIGR02453 family)